VVNAILRRAREIFGHSEAEPAPVVLKKKTSAYHAVTIAPGLRACEAAKAVARKRFLSAEAPDLPLQGCSCSTCACRYEHHDDRRNGQRRARDMGVSIDGYDATEKRLATRRGRRKNET
jgi:hypothetical protein